MNIRGWEEFFKRENGAGASGVSQERTERGLRAGRSRADNLFAHGQGAIRMDSGDEWHGAESQGDWVSGNDRLR